MRSNPFIRIKSPNFAVLPGEKEELHNDGIYGKALAVYLQSKLGRLGYDTPFVCCEDWGWWVEVRGKTFTLGIGVYGFEGDDGSLDLCATVPTSSGRHWSWKRFRMIDRTPDIEALQEQMITILRQDEAVDVVSVTEDFPLG